MAPWYTESGRRIDVKFHHGAMTRSIMILGIMAAVAFTGCSDESGITEVEMSGAEVLFTEDPLDGVLNSTMDYTPPDPTERIDKLAEVLGLDEDQKAALLAAYIEFREGVAELRELVKAGDLTCEEAKEQVTVLREAFEAELQLILTPEQYDLLQELRQSMDKDRIRDKDSHERWLVWLAEIGTDEDQTAAVLAALEAFRAEMQNLHDQVQAGTLTMDEAREAAVALRAEFDAALQAILTPEQYEALQELRPDCEGKQSK
jgi:Spy/CpxP family protein refolding chaperone